MVIPKLNKRKRSGGPYVTCKNSDRSKKGGPNSEVNNGKKQIFKVNRKNIRGGRYHSQKLVQTGLREVWSKFGSEISSGASIFLEKFVPGIQSRGLTFVVITVLIPIMGHSNYGEIFLLTVSNYASIV